MRCSTLFHGVLIVLFSSFYAMAQGSGSSRAAPPSSSGSSRTNHGVPTTQHPPTPTQFTASFWKYLNNPKSPYYRWGTPGKTKHQEQRPGLGAMGGQMDTPHRGVGQTFLNGTANKDLKQVPVGSVLVREEYTPDRKARANITVMYRSKGADPKNGDWYWIMYKPDGSLARTPADQGNRAMAGRVRSCVECHRRAGGNDFVFLNDQPVPPPRRPVPQGSGSRR